jgi:hypothetical protein
MLQQFALSDRSAGTPDEQLQVLVLDPVTDRPVTRVYDLINCLNWSNLLP